MIAKGAPGRRIKRQNLMMPDRQFHPMDCPRMAKLATVAIALLVCGTSGSQIYRNDPRGSIEGKEPAGERDIPLQKQ